MSTAYYDTPLAKKLGIKEGYKMLLHHPPDDYFLLFNDLPQGLSLVENDFEKEIDFAHIFSANFDEMKEVFKATKKRIKKNGMIWVSYPKATSAIPTDIKRDAIRSFGLEIGLVDVKVCSVTEDWSAIKYMYRIKDR
jgi:hypothetical protein